MARQLILPLLDEFSKDTCVKVNVIAASSGLEQRIKTEGANSPADVLLTVDIGRLEDAIRAGISQILSRRGIEHSFSGHPSMSGLFFSEQPPRGYRDWASSDYTFYEALAPELHDLGVLCEPGSR